MVEIAVKYLESTTGARRVAGDPDRVCRGVVIDSREVGPDAIFVAFPGERVDGTISPPPLLRRRRRRRDDAGADQTLVDAAHARNCSLLTCDDPTEFLLRLAQGYRARLHCTVIGVTGSIGKTTTKDVLAACLAKRFRVHATAGNYNNLIGLPLTILSAPADTQMLVLEMGMNDFGEIARLTACAQPTFAIITKVGTSHIGMLGSREGTPAPRPRFFRACLRVPRTSRGTIPPSCCTARMISPRSSSRSMRGLAASMWCLRAPRPMMTSMRPM